MDYGGRVEDLVLNSQSTGAQRRVLLTHDNNATAVLENKWWKGMLLIPWANRIAYVCVTLVQSLYVIVHHAKWHLHNSNTISGTSDKGNQYFSIKDNQPQFLLQLYTSKYRELSINSLAHLRFHSSRVVIGKPC